jgi:two-component system OmpR family sensor kinase
MGRLFWKILFGFWLTLLAVALLVSAFSYFYFTSRLHGPGEVAEGRRVAPITTAAASSLHLGGIPGLQSLFNNWPRFLSDQLMVVDDHDRDVLGRPVSLSAIAEARRQLEKPEEPERQSVREVIAPDQQHYLLFVLSNAAPHGPPPLLRGPPLRLLVGIALAGLLFSAGLAWYLARPLKTLSDAFARVADGDLEARVAPSMGKRRDEIADLGQDFDRMTERLKTLVSAQRQLLHDVSHELRSPLGRLQVAVGLARQQPERIASSLDRIELEAGRLDQMVGELLTISRLEVGNHQDWDDYFDLVELLETIISDARFEASDKGVQIALRVEGADAEAVMRGRAELMHRALENIVRNALKYSSAQQTVTVQLSRATPESVMIRVMDQGPGVPPEHLKDMFEPFVRVDEARSSPGYGLGLAIAQRSVAAHHGSIEASNLAGGGLCVTVTLPLHVS